GRPRFRRTAVGIVQWHLRCPPRDGVVRPLRAAALGALVLAAGCVLDDRTLTVAGAAGTSGHADAGGPAGADGASDTPPLVVCHGIPVTAALITDFSDAVPGQSIP